jgi:predicted Zn-dependent protease
MGWLFKKKQKDKYLSPEELEIYPGQLRWKIYQGFCAGKTANDIYHEISGEFAELSKGDGLVYVERFHKKMKGELRRCPYCKTFMAEEVENSAGGTAWYCKRCERYLESIPAPGKSLSV